MVLVKMSISATLDLHPEQNAMGDNFDVVAA